MKLFAASVLAAGANAAIGSRVVEMVQKASDRNEQRLMNQWVMWKNKFEKVYETFEEEVERMETWLANMARIEEHNFEYALGHKTYSMAMNHYGDLKPAEFTKVYNGFLNSKKGLHVGETYSAHLGDALDEDLDHGKGIDWRKEGAVSDVKDQGQCGSCWAFSSTGALEGHMKIKFGALPDLSEQNLVDCSKPEGNQGCNGGLMAAAFQYVKDQDGIDDEESYPYEAVDFEPCRYTKSHRAADDKGFRQVPEGDEHGLKHALAREGPVSVAIDASNPSFQFYKEGVYYEPDCSPENLDHGVLAVGFGVEKGEKYFLVKNSWSTQWGDAGYIKMARDKDNHCGIASYAVFPIVTDPNAAGQL